MRHKSHPLFAWLAKLVQWWTTNFFIKEAADPAFVSWHQDSTYWGLSAPDVVTVGSRSAGRRRVSIAGLPRRSFAPI